MNMKAGFFEKVFWMGFISLAMKDLVNAVDYTVEQQKNCEYELEFNDDFTHRNPEVLSSQLWRSDNFHGSECINYTNPNQTFCFRNSEANIFRRDNQLVLKANVEPDGTLTGPSIWTFPKFRYGRFIIHAKMPKGHGLWPHLALVDEYDDDDDNTQIKSIMSADIAYLHGSMTQALCAGIYDEDRHSTQTEPLHFPCIEDFAESFHEFRLDWDPVWLRWYLDGVMYFEYNIKGPASDRKETPDAIFFEEKLHLTLQLIAKDVPASKSWPSPELIIKSVQIYQKVLLSARFFYCPYELTSATSCLEKNAFIQDTEQYFSDPNNALPQAVHKESGVWSLEQVTSYLKETAKELGEFASYQAIGTSVENRSIEALCLGIGCSGAEMNKTIPIPQVLYTGMHHSREPMSTLNLIYMMQYVRHQIKVGNVDVVALLFSREMWFVPIVNPDGYAYNLQNEVWKHDAGQRKNRRPSCPKSPADTGVDLNRNYDVCFDIDNIGSHPGHCDEDYRGPEPFSEPETLAMEKFVGEHHFSAALNYHSYGKSFNIPNSCKALGVPKDGAMDTFNSLAKEMTRFNKYKYGHSWQDSSLYVVNGAASDWMWNKHGIYAMSPETGPDANVEDPSGFWPSDPNDIKKICQDLLYSNVFLAKASGPIYELSIVGIEHSEMGKIIDVELQNIGLKPGGTVEVVLARTLDGHHSQLHTVENLPSAVPTKNSPPPQKFQFVLKKEEKKTGGSEYYMKSNTEPLYIAVRDIHTCQLYRLSLGPYDYMLSAAHHGPNCGSCMEFGNNTKIAPAEHIKCTNDDIVKFTTFIEPKSIPVKKASQGKTPPKSPTKPVEIDNTNKTITTSVGPDGVPLPPETPENKTVKEDTPPSIPVEKVPSDQNAIQKNVTAASTEKHAINETSGASADKSAAATKNETKSTPATSEPKEAKNPAKEVPIRLKPVDKELVTDHPAADAKNTSTDEPDRLKPIDTTNMTPDRLKPVDLGQKETKEPKKEKDSPEEVKPEQKEPPKKKPEAKKPLQNTPAKDKVSTPLTTEPHQQNPSTDSKKDKKVEPLDHAKDRQPAMGPDSLHDKGSEHESRGKVPAVSNSHMLLSLFVILFAIMSFVIRRIIRRTSGPASTTRPSKTQKREYDVVPNEEIDEESGRRTPRHRAHQA